jgi:hypothetical protein
VNQLELWRQIGEKLERVDHGEIDAARPGAAAENQQSKLFTLAHRRQAAPAHRISRFQNSRAGKKVGTAGIGGKYAVNETRHQLVGETGP